MTKSVGVHEAKTRLSQLLEEVGAGASIVITNRGVPVARLVPEPTIHRTFGTDIGVFSVPTDFDDPLPVSVLETFE